MATQAAERQQVGQEALASLVPAAVVGAWPLLDPHDLTRTLPDLIAALTAVIHRYGRASAVAALDHYLAQRVTAGVTGRPVLAMPADPSAETIASAVRSSVSGLYGPTSPEVELAAQELLAGEVEKLVLDYGRTAMTGAVAADPKARGWARVPNAGACSFCLMLASNGAVYKSAAAAGRRPANAQWADAKGYTNAYHPNCRCTVEPVFGVYEMTARARAAEALWKTSTKGLSGADARKAFRRAVEGRTGGPTRSQKRG